MNLTDTDAQVLSGIRNACLELGLDIIDERPSNNFHVFSLRFSDISGLRHVLRISYHAKHEVIGFYCWLTEPVPKDKEPALLEVLNYINHRLVPARITLEPDHHVAELRGEMNLFGAPLPKHFRRVLFTFLVIARDFLPMVSGFLSGRIRKEDIKNEIDSPESPEYVVLAREVQ